VGKSQTGTSHKTAKALLGELYADKEYLEKLLKDDGEWSIGLSYFFLLIIIYTTSLIKLWLPTFSESNVKRFFAMARRKFSKNLSCVALFS